jgi:hypothetical protein
MLPTFLAIGFGLALLIWGITGFARDHSGKASRIQSIINHYRK